MIKRVTWFVSGAVAGAAGAGVAKRKVKAKAAELTPARMARGASQRVRDAVGDGRRAMRAREAELRARVAGVAPVSLADELEPYDTVLVDGEPVEAGKVIVLRQVRDDEPRRRRG